MEQELIDALANETNQSILSLLAIEPTYPRSISELLSLSESDVSRRLGRLEEVGLVRSRWEHVDGRNVKTYRLAIDEVNIGIESQGLRIEATGRDETPDRQGLIDQFRAQIPEPEGFVGRQRELGVLRRAGPVVVVEGIAGIGKTSLIARWAREEQDAQPVWFHTFSGTESLTWLANRLGVFHARHGDSTLLDAIEASAPLADQRELLLETLDTEGTVTVMDAVERVRDEDLRDVIADAIERVRDGKLVVAGRQIPRFDPTTDSLRKLRLQGLSPENVADLLADRGIQASEETVERVHRQLGGHPLAINLLVQAAAEGPTPLEALLDESPDNQIEDYLLEEVHASLSETERRVLAYASVFHGPFSSEDVAAVYPGNPEGALVKLRRKRLLRSGGDRYRMHDLLRSFFRDRLDEPAAVHEQAAGRALKKGTLEARLEALYHLLEAGKRTRVLDLLERDLDLAEFDLVEDGYHNLYLDVLERLDPDRIADESRAALVQDEIGDVRFHRGENEQALARYREAAQRFEEIGAGDRLADLAWKRALALRELGRKQAAVERVQSGLEEHDPDERTRQRLNELADALGVGR